MPIFPSKSKKSMDKKDDVKPQSLSIALGVQRKNKAKAAPKMMAEGGEVETLGTKIGFPGSPKPKPTPKPMAEGGLVETAEPTQRDIADAIIAKRRMSLEQDNEDAALHENDDEAMDDMTDLHDDSADESPKDMVSILRERIKSRRGV